MWDVAVVGAGAAGMAAAIAAAEGGRRVALLEKAERPGRKVLASGNGRCNLLNLGPPRYYGEEDFALRALTVCPPEDVIAFFRRLGLYVTETEDGRAYPVTWMATSVVSALQTGLRLWGVETFFGYDVRRVKKTGDCFLLEVAGREPLCARRVILCCGGPAQPRLGGSDDGIRLAERLGHTAEPVFAALTPLRCEARSISGLSGLRVRAGVSVVKAGRRLYSTTGEVLFTEYGASGICVMQCARFARGEDVRLELDFLSCILNREEALDELKRKRALLSGFSPVALLEGLLCAKLAYAVLKQAGIPLRGETADTLDDRQLEQIVETGFCYRMPVLGDRGLDYAQVSAGGIHCREVNPQTMESRVLPGLYLAGEELNVDGDCGGFNLMFAFASGLIAGRSACRRFSEEENV